ncbi:hypothetical protein Tco_1358557, partial [Tanacetum coccineum]
VAVDQSAGPADQAEDQPSSSAPLPSSSYSPVISATIASEPTPVAELISVRIYQKSQDNRQKRASTDTRTEE